MTETSSEHIASSLTARETKQIYPTSELRRFYSQLLNYLQLVILRIENTTTTPGLLH